MRILLIGGGGREHALGWVLTAGRPDVSVVCAPGNPGIASLATCRSADLRQPSTLLAIAEQEKADLTVVGPELPLSAGVADAFAAAGRPIVGPTRAAAALEWSKVFAKHFMARHGVPTAKFADCGTADEALAAIARGDLGYPLVIKADGLAAGKGVVIAEDRASAEAAVREAMVDRKFGSAGDRVVLEEFLAGQEASYFVLSDGRSFVRMSSAQDHKRIHDDDRGPNTGGMGAFAPSPLVTPELEQRVLDEIVEPVLNGMRLEGHPFSGFLYVGLMLTAAGPKVVEFNVRFGDPEAQVILPMLDEDLPHLLMAAATGTLPSRALKIRDERLVGVVIASAGYPESADSGRVISGLEAAASVPGALVFHAGTAARQGDVVTAGGRVLTVVGRGPSYQDAIAVAYRAVGEIRFDGMQFRTDIGRKALAVERLS
ncbi:MAG TPA: phosphoribosylamine--glycine ligase [Vicinamibacterales bacterium]|nr:phosphoribosylamine--glycine ligase [Vicinamibacterales bacterium]